MNKRKIGVTIGKFMPLHKGHEAMIEFAASQVDELIIIVSSGSLDGREVLGERHSIIKNYYKGRNISVRKHIDDMGPPKQTDEYGTALEEDFWKYWFKVFRGIAPEATHFISSDRYGKEAAARLGIEWIPFDPDRELFDISASKIRSDPTKYWKYISDAFRPSYVRTVVVVGPESSGKSTLVKDLGAAWNSPAVPEYGRIMTEAIDDDQWTQDDFNKIVNRQQEINRLAAIESETGVIFIDTESFTTHLYAQAYLGDRYTHFEDQALNQSHYEFFDLYVLVEPNLPWVNDGTRVMSAQSTREEFYLSLKNRFSSTNRIILSETDRKKRVELVSLKVAKFFKQEENFEDRVLIT